MHGRKPVFGFADVGAAARHCPFEVAVGQVLDRHGGVVFLVMMHLAQVRQIVVRGLAANRISNNIRNCVLRFRRNGRREDNKFPYRSVSVRLLARRTTH
jgi:hypothetical protein